MTDKIKSDETLVIARRVLQIEADAVLGLKERLDGSLSDAVELILSASGKVVVTGIGKSGIICQKIASTLASTGTAAFFLHPAEGAHGDLGMLMKNDILIALSNSGETGEILTLAPLIKRLGIKVIAMTGKADSAITEIADVVIDIGVAEEACPLGLAPTASTTAALAMGDALAVALLEVRGFKSDDFATLHPAGSLGRKLKKVAHIMHTGSGVPKVELKTLMKDVVMEMTGKKLGIAGVFDGGKLKGVITDGDLRRALGEGESLVEKTAEAVMSKNPKTIEGNALAEAALKIMDDNTITALFVVDDDGEVSGIVHLHDLIKAGVL